MALITIDEVRELGKLPDNSQLPVSIIQPHLDSAVRELTGLIGDYASAAGDKKERCKEAEGCLCMALLLMSINTLYTEGATTLQQELGGMNVMFHSVEDQVKLSEQWRERAMERVSEYFVAGNKRPLAWYAI